MVRTTSARLLMATVSTLAISAAANAQQSSSSADINQQAAETQNAPIAETAVVLDTVTVTANKLDTSVIDAPASISVVDDDELDRFQPDGLGDMLNSLPGVETSGGPRSSVQIPTIRGLTDDRVVVRIDGARANLRSGHKGGIFIDPEMLKSAEIYRGPASTMQGTGALGGAVVLQTLGAKDLLEGDDRIGARVKVGYASVDHKLTLNSTAYGRPTENSDILVGVTRKSGGSYENGSGEKEPYTDDNYINGLFKGGIDFSDTGRLYMTVQRYTDDHYLPAAPDGDSLSNIVDRETEQLTGVFGAEYFSPTNDLIDFNGTVYGMRTDLDEKRLSDGRHDERTLETIGIEGSNTARFDLGGNELAVTLGGEVFEDTQEGRRDGEPTTGLFPDAEMLISGVYLDNRLTLMEDLELTAGVRYDSFDQSATGQSDRSDDAISPRFSVAYRVTSWLQPYVSYAEAFNAPSLSQLYNDGLHFAIPGPTPDNYFVPNPDLDPERAKTWEFGANFKVDHLLTHQDVLRAKVAVFRNEVTDYIEQSTDVAAGTTTSSNLPEAEIKGFEAEVNYDTGLLFSSVAVSMLRGENSETGEYLSNIQGDKVSLSGGYRFMDKALELGGRATMVAGQDRVPDDTAKRGGYTRLDLFARWDASDYVDGLQVNAGIDNLLDQTYRTSDAIIYEPGRNFKISASMKF